MPPRLPDATKKARGTLRKSRTPAAVRGAGVRGELWIVPSRCPNREATKDYAAAWRELAAAVNSARSVSSADRPAFGQMVAALSLARTAQRQLETEGATIDSGSGAVKASPFVALWAQGQRAFFAAAARFSLVPADRDRAEALGSGGKTAEDLKFDEFMSFGKRP